MKPANYTHKAFDGTKTVKGWILKDEYGDKIWVYFNGVDICVHPLSDWDGELIEVKE